MRVNRTFRLSVLVVCVLSLVLMGCGGYPSHGPSLELAREDGITAYEPALRYHFDPVLRLGSLPCPGTFTLYQIGEPDRLGTHRYQTRFDLPDRGDEQSRGIIYTRDAGFLDIAHLRNTIDLTLYATVRVRTALEQGRTTMTLKSSEPSLYHVTFNYPDDWDRLSGRERQRLIDELSIRIGQRMAYHMITWHEIITWFGYKGWGIVPEDSSSFTYDDTASHMVAIYIAERALRDRGRDLDQAVTVALRQELDRLGLVSREQAEQAIARVEGRWWRDGEVRLRYVQLGIDGETFEPWLVSGLPFTRDAKPLRLCLPSLRDVQGRDFTGFYRLEIDPQIFEGEAILTHLTTHTQQVEPSEDFPELKRTLQQQMHIADEAIPHVMQ